MSAGFTPGPWGINVRGNEQFTVRGANNSVLIAQAYYPRGSANPYDERKSNAHLIAAAPALYANSDKASKLMMNAASVLRDCGLEDLAIDLEAHVFDNEAALAQARGDLVDPLEQVKL